MKKKKNMILPQRAESAKENDENKLEDKKKLMSRLMSANLRKQSKPNMIESKKSEKIFGVAMLLENVMQTKNKNEESGNKYLLGSDSDIQRIPEESKCSEEDRNSEDFKIQPNSIPDNILEEKIDSSQSKDNDINSSEFTTKIILDKPTRNQTVKKMKRPEITY